MKVVGVVFLLVVCGFCFFSYLPILFAPARSRRSLPASPAAVAREYSRPTLTASAPVPQPPQPKYSIRTITPIAWSDTKQKFACQTFGSSFSRASMQFMNGIIGGGWINWEGSYDRGLNELTLRVKNLRTYPMGEDGTTLQNYGVGYRVTLTGATFEDGTMAKCFLVEHSFLGDKAPPGSLAVPVSVIKKEIPPYTLTGVWAGGCTSSAGGETSASRGILMRLRQDGCRIEAQAIEAETDQAEGDKSRYLIDGWALKNRVTLLHTSAGNKCCTSSWVLVPSKDGSYLRGTWYQGFQKGEIVLRKVRNLQGPLQAFESFQVPGQEPKTPIPARVATQAPRSEANALDPGRQAPRRFADRVHGPVAQSRSWTSAPSRPASPVVRWRRPAHGPTNYGVHPRVTIYRGPRVARWGFYGRRPMITPARPYVRLRVVPPGRMPRRRFIGRLPVRRRWPGR